jgi:hypothetical protein
MERDTRATARIVIELARQNRWVAYTLRAQDPESLERISGLLHDQWFHLPLAGREGNDYVIPFVVEETDEIEVMSRTWRGRPKRWRVPLYRAELRIANVEDVEVDDRGQIQTFMCVALSHDSTTRAVELEAAEHAEIRVTVRHLDVVLSRSDEHAADDYRRSILFGEVSGSPKPDPWPEVM